MLEDKSVPFGACAPRGSMHRRDLLRFGAAVGIIAPALSALAARRVAAGQPIHDRVYFDERFARARAFALRLAPGMPLTAVRGGVTAVWTNDLVAASRTQPLLLAGVTAESFHFCLKMLLQARAPVRSQIARLDRDLYAWVVDTRSISRNG